jgi:hypothetical protein
LFRAGSFPTHAAFGGPSTASVRFAPARNLRDLCDL